MSSEVVRLHERAERIEKVLPRVVEATLPLIWARDAGSMIDVEYIVKLVIGRGTLFVIYGAPKSGKTFLATDLSLCVATGRNWFGHRVKPGLVIYVASEMGARVQRRVRAWMDHHLGDEADKDLPFAIVPHVVNLLNDLEVDRLVETLEQLVAERGPPALILVDTLARSMVGGDENSAQDMGRAIAVADLLRDRFNATTGLVHHTGKNAAAGSRGSSALLGAADAYIKVECDDQGNRSAEIEWSRDGESGQVYGFRLRLVELGIDSEGDTVTTCVVVPAIAVARTKPQPTPKGADSALKALKEMIAEFGEPMPGTSVIPRGIKAVTMTRWRERAYFYDPLDSADESQRTKATDARMKRFARARQALQTAELISIAGEFVWLYR